jgi:signal transduction histidine kinase
MRTPRQAYAWRPTRLGLPAATVIVDLSAFRIAQGGLTNVLKRGGVARVLVRYSPVAADIADDGRAGADEAPGEGISHGLIGMRE